MLFSFCTTLSRSNSVQDPPIYVEWLCFMFCGYSLFIAFLLFPCLSHPFPYSPMLFFHLWSAPSLSPCVSVFFSLPLSLIIDGMDEVQVDVLHCEFCGKRGYAHTFLRSNRFCSTACVRRWALLPLENLSNAQAWVVHRVWIQSLFCLLSSCTKSQECDNGPQMRSASF